MTKTANGTMWKHVRQSAQAEAQPPPANALIDSKAHNMEIHYLKLTVTKRPAAIF